MIVVVVVVVIEKAVGAATLVMEMEVVEIGVKIVNHTTVYHRNHFCRPSLAVATSACY